VEIEQVEVTKLLGVTLVVNCQSKHIDTTVAKTGRNTIIKL
jgi:hypothetical protein